MNKTRIISLILAVVLVVSCFTLVGCGMENTTANRTLAFASVMPLSASANTTETDGNIEAAPTEVPQMILHSLTATTGNFPTVTLQATVTPAIAENKKVDWSVAWVNPNSSFASGKNVTEYVTVTPQSDGSNIATVTCIKAFGEEQIRIIVTTRDGGFTAECIAKYTGIPTSIVIVTGITEKSSTTDGTWTPLQANRTYDFTINMGNALNSVGTKFNSYTASVTGWGSFIMAEKTVNAFAPQFGWMPTGKTESKSLESLKNEFLEVSIVNGKLHVVVKQPIESYYTTWIVDGSQVGLPSQSYKSEFSGWDTDVNGSKSCYFTIRVTETTSGLYTDLIVHIESGVRSVTVNKTQIGF